MSSLMQSPDKSRKPWLRTAVTGLTIIIVVAVVIGLLLYRESRSRFDLPVAVYVCGSAIDLTTVDPLTAPVGCKTVPGGIDLSMINPGHKAHAYTNGFFGFRDVRKGSSDATLVVAGVIDSSTIGMIGIDKDDERQVSEMTEQVGADGQPTWTASLRFTPDLTGISIYIVTSPDSP